MAKKKKEDPKATTDTPLKGFITHLTLAALLREYYCNDILYMGRNLNDLRDYFVEHEVSGSHIAACDAIVTFSTLCSAMNAPFYRSDAQKMKINDPIIAAQLSRIGKLRFFGDDKFDLRLRSQNPEISKKAAQLWYDIPDKEADLKEKQAELDAMLSSGTGDKKAIRKAHSAVNSANKSLDKLKDAYDTAPEWKRMLAKKITRTQRDDVVTQKDGVTYHTTRTKKPHETVYAAQVDGYKYEYCVPLGTTGKSYIYIEDVNDPEHNLERPDTEQGVDVRSIETLLTVLTTLQPYSDELAAQESDDGTARDDFAALMGFRLKQLQPDEVFPGLNAQDKAAVANFVGSGTNSLLYRIEPAAKQKNLPMILTAYLPYLTTAQKQQLESGMELTRRQQELYLNILNVYGEDAQDDAATNGVSDPLKVLDLAVDAVLEAKAHYAPLDVGSVEEYYLDAVDRNPKAEPMNTPGADFWYEFHYTKWDWKEKDGTLVPVLTPITGPDGQPKVIQLLPFQIVSSEGKIYLVGLRLEMPDAQNRPDGQWVLSNLRVDRIRDLHKVYADKGVLHNPEKDKSKLKEYYMQISDTAEQNMAYRNQSPKMFSGTPKDWMLDCSPAITNVLADTFGADALEFCDKVPAPLPLDREPGDTPKARPDWNRIQVKACWDGIRLFLLQNLDNVQLSDAPEQDDARSKMSNLLFNAGENYDMQ